MQSEEHGGLDQSELEAMGLKVDEVLDFSTNVNPGGPSPKVKEAVSRVEIGRYPDRSNLALNKLLARLNNVSGDSLLVGNGTAELIWLICRAFLDNHSLILITAPTFGEYSRSAKACGAQVIEVRASQPDFQPDLDAWLSIIKERQPDLFFVCNPNNPTGWNIPDSDLAQLAKAMRPNLVVIDEAYRGFTDRGPFGEVPLNNVIVLRSMTKDFALAGLRLGYALAKPSLIAAMQRQQPPWSVNAFAQAAGLAALEDLDHLHRTVHDTQIWAQQLKSDLSQRGARISPSPMHYFIVEVGDGRTVRQQLLAHGCLVRDAASFGLPRWIRIGVRRPAENQRLLELWHLTGFARTRDEIDAHA